MNLRKCLIVGVMVAAAVLSAAVAFGQTTVDDSAFSIYIGTTWSTTYPPGAHNMTEKVCSVVPAQNNNHDAYHSASVANGWYAVYFRWEVAGADRKTQYGVYNGAPGGAGWDGNVVQSGACPADKTVGGKAYKKLKDIQIANGNLQIWFGNMRDGVTKAAFDAYYYEPTSPPGPTPPAPVTIQVNGNVVSGTYAAVSGATSYRVSLRDVAAQNEVQVLSANNGTSYSFSGVAAGTYLVRVLANGAQGQTADSDSAVVSSSAPAPVLASVSGQSIAVSWSAVDGASTYRVSLRTSDPPGEYSVQAGVPGTSTVFPNVGPGTYFVRVLANGVAVPFADSSPVTVEGGSSAPAPVYATVNGFTVTVTWRNVSGATGYQLYLRKVPTNEVYRVITSVAGTAYEFHNVQSGRYYAEVFALQPSTGSGASNAFDVGAGQGGGAWGEAAPATFDWGRHVYGAPSVRPVQNAPDRVRARLLVAGYGEQQTRFDTSGFVRFNVELWYRRGGNWDWYTQSYRVTVGRNGYINLERPVQVYADNPWVDPAFVEALLAGPGGLSVGDDGNGTLTDPAGWDWKNRSGIKDLAAAISFFESFKYDRETRQDFKSYIPRSADQSFDGDGGGGAGETEYVFSPGDKQFSDLHTNAWSPPSSVWAKLYQWAPSSCGTRAWEFRTEVQGLPYLNWSIVLDQSTMDSTWWGQIVAQVRPILRAGLQVVLTLGFVLFIIKRLWNLS